MVACGWVQHDHRLMWRQSDVLSGRPIHPRVLALSQSRLLTAMCWDCVRVAGGQPWLSWRAGSASIAGIGTGLGDTLYCRPKFCAVFLCSAFCKPPLLQSDDRYAPFPVGYRLRVGYGAVQKPEIPRQSTGRDRKCASCREISCMRMACCISESLTVPVPPFSNHNHHPNDTVWHARGHNNQRQRQRFASLLWIPEDWGAASESSFYFFRSFFYLDF